MNSQEFIITNQLIDGFIQNLKTDDQSAFFQHVNEEWTPRLRQLTTMINRLTDEIPRGLHANHQRELQGLIIQLRITAELSVAELGTGSRLEHPQSERRRIGDLYRKILRIERQLGNVILTPPDQSKIYGSKYTNLERMWQWTQQEPEPGFAIPRPVGISSPETEALLQAFSPDVLTDWQDIANRYEAYKQAPGNIPFLEQESIKAMIESIHRRITEAFNEIARDPGLLSAICPEKLTVMVATLKRQNDYTMVRSTGAEDTAAAANAGGNVSVPYVPRHVSGRHARPWNGCGLLLFDQFSKKSAGCR
jgi:hypothetical protein